MHDDKKVYYFSFLIPKNNFVQIMYNDIGFVLRIILVSFYDY